MKFSLDSHKAFLHPHRVEKYLMGKLRFPITVEMSPTAVCNQNCIMCAYDYKAEHVQMKKEDLLSVCEKIAVAGELGDRTESVVFSGEGEPMLSPSLSTATAYLHKVGKHIGLMTNGTIEAVKYEVGRCAWIRFSINASSPDVYSRLHGKDQCELVFNNLRATVLRRNHLHATGPSGTTIGVQMLLLDDNEQEVFDLCRDCKDIGVDYFVVKPVSCHPLSCNKVESPIEFSKALALELENQSTKDFQAVYRHNAFSRGKKPYKHCLAAPWFHLITSDMRVWPCAQWVGLEEYCLGHMKYQTWEEVVTSKQHKEIMHHLMTKFDVSTCRHPCRLDKLNEDLHHLNDLGPHDYFI